MLIEHSRWSIDDYEFLMSGPVLMSTIVYMVPLIYIRTNCWSLLLKGQSPHSASPQAEGPNPLHHPCFALKFVLQKPSDSVQELPVDLIVALLHPRALVATS